MFRKGNRFIYRDFRIGLEVKSIHYFRAELHHIFWKVVQLAFRYDPIKGVFVYNRANC